jgi:hypothetical protein
LGWASVPGEEKVISAVSGLGDRRGVALAVPAVVAPVEAALPVARVIPRRVTVLPPTKIVVDSVIDFDRAYRVGTIVDTFA